MRFQALNLGAFFKAQPDTPPGVSVDSTGSTGGAGAPGHGAPVTQPAENHTLPVERWPLVQRYFSPAQ